MNKKVYIAGTTAAANYAGQFLQKAGAHCLSALSKDVDYILLDVPSFNQEGLLRDGRNIANVINSISNDTVFVGGNLSHPALAGFRVVDLLQDPQYLAENAYITAECALDVALPYLSITLRHCPVLIIGWGRIGKCLAGILKALDANVTVSARKEADRAMLRALGYQAVDTDGISNLSQYRLIFNTVPERILCQEQMAKCRQDCVKIDLASRPGILDDDVIVARGLPGIHFPESSGRLIAETIFRKENLL